MTKRQPRVKPLARFNADNPAVLAGRRGFDDGYFRNDEEQYHFATEAERAAYDAEFAIGRKQRKGADRAADKKAKR